VLSDPEKRRVYDRYGSAGPQEGFPGGGFQGGFPGGGSFYSNVSPEQAAGFSDFFRSLFGSGFTGDPFAGGGFPGGGFAGAPRSVPARPTEAKLQVELERAFHGGPMSVRIDGRAFEVTIPAGVRPGAKLRLRGGAPGGSDLVLHIEHAPHAVFRLDGSTLHASVDVPDFAAVLGGEVSLATLEGDVSLTIPPGTQSGRKLRLRGRGWPTGGEGERGDLVAEVRVRIPARPTPEQQHAYETLRQLAQGEGDPHS
jgi:curved DNA-binding protein